VRNKYTLELLLKIRRINGAEKGGTASFGPHLGLHELSIILLVLQISGKLFTDL
jgi:hypothetical protein